MRNLKRVLSLALALVMVLGMMVITTSAADFTDAEEITYTEAVDVMSALGILKGYEAANGTFSFNPKGTLNRQEAAKILAFVCMGTEADDYLTGSTKSFDDVAADHWAAKYIAYCKNLGIINGVNDAQTLFNPTGTLTTVQFAKMLLVAIEVEGTYTGAGWEENVKDAVAKVGTMAATGIKIDNSDITREEACELALAAMKAGEEYSNGYYIAGYEKEFGYCATYADAYIMAKALEIEDFDPDEDIVKHSATKNTLLGDIYEVTFNPDATDKFGRPGNSYTYEVEGEDEPVVLFFADKALAKFEGPVAQKDIFAAAGVKDKTVPSIEYTIMEDGLNITTEWKYVTGVAAKDNKDSVVDEQAAAGTGYGIKSELYVEVVDETPVYTLVSIRDYLGTVTDVTPADEEDPTSKRTIDVTLDVAPTGRVSNKVIAGYETEDFAKGDVVVVNVAATEIQTIAAAKTVKGTPTKIAKGAVTIAGTEYVASQNAYGVAYALGTAGEWYLDSMGNLIATVGAPRAAEYYGIFLKTEGQEYEAASESLLDTEDGQEAAEVIQILTPDNKAVVYNTAWKYLYNAAETEIVGVDFFVADNQDVEDEYTWESAEKMTLTAGRLVKYTLDKNGAINSISMVTDSNDANGQLKAGKATLGTGYDKVVTDKTVFFVKVNTANSATDKYVAYTGYKTVPTVNFTNTVYYVEGKIPGTNTSNGTYDIIVLDGSAVSVTVPKTNLIYFADNAYTEEWDAEEEAIAYIYENVYLNGEKTSVTFYAEQPAAKGAMYAYSVNSKTGALVIDYATNLLVGTDVIALTHADFFVAGDVHYVDADTAYYQITKTGMTKVEALPEVKTSESIVVKYVVNNYDDQGAVTTAAAVFFQVVKTADIDETIVAVDSDAELIAAAATKDVILTAGVEVTADALVMGEDAVLDGNGQTVAIDADMTQTAGEVEVGIKAANGGTIKNVTIAGGVTGINFSGSEDDAVLNVENVTIKNSHRGINGGSTDGVNLVTLNVTNSTLAGQTSYMAGTATFTNCSFVVNSELDKPNKLEPYTTTVLDGCSFEAGFALDATSLNTGYAWIVGGGHTITLKNCYVGTTLVTADNLTTLLGANAAGATVANG